MSRFGKIPVCHFLVWLLVVSFSACADDYLVSTQKEYREAVQKAAAGDVIKLANGEWRDFEIVLEAYGRSGAPVTLTAETPGKVIISGRSNLRIAGEYLLVSGLVFKNGYTPTSTVISFRRSKEKLANNSRITQVVIDNFNNPERYETDFWVLMYGRNNRFDHNHLVGKRNKGVTMAVRLNTEASQNNNHRIDHNYFGPRPILGSNGGETLRIGTSHYSLSNSNTLVENNYFDRTNGELEVISNKSGGNIFRNNTFYEARGTLTMRHGNGNLVEGNVFFGNDKDHTGGIRVINADQTIRNNYMEGLKGTRFGGALTVMNGVPNSPINRYHQVERALIENNSVINSDHIQLAAGSDDERSAVPVDSRFDNNLIFNDPGKDVFTVYDDVSGIAFKGNLVNQVAVNAIPDGFDVEDVTVTRAANGLMYAEGYPSVGAAQDLQPTRREDTGVSWYPKRDPDVPFETGTTIHVEPGQDTLTKALKTAREGDILLLGEGEYIVSEFLIVDKTISVRAAKPALDADNVLITFERTALFEITDGGNLQLYGLTISGAEAPDSAGNAVIRTPKKSLLRNYRLEMDGCRFINLNINHSFNFLTVSQGTFADSIVITNSQFKDVTGAILKLDRETDDFGIYNAEYVTVAGSTFTNVGGALVDFYRGGTDESTFGPHFLLSGSTLSNVGNNRRNKSGASVHLHGVQVATVEQNLFENSPAIKVMHTVGEPVTRITENIFSGVPAPKVVELNSLKKNTALIAGNKEKKP